MLTTAGVTALAISVKPGAAPWTTGTAGLATIGVVAPAACVNVAYSPPTNARDARRSNPATTPKFRDSILLIASPLVENLLLSLYSGG
jgi:hypothetical protein